MCPNKFSFFLPCCLHLVADSCLTEIHSQGRGYRKVSGTPFTSFISACKAGQVYVLMTQQLSRIAFCITILQLILVGVHIVYPTVHRNTIPKTGQRLKLMCIAM